MKAIVQNILLVVLALILHFFAIGLIARFLYIPLFVDLGPAGFVIDYDIEVYIGSQIAAYVLFITLLFTSFGKGKIYWWIGILLLPALFFIYGIGDLPRIWFYILVGLVGWTFGFGVQKLLEKSKATASSS